MLPGIVTIGNSLPTYLPTYLPNKYANLFLQNSADSGRDIYSYYSIPYGQPTSGERRFAPPEFADPVNNGKEVFDATYLTYLWNALGRVCPQVILGLIHRDRSYA